MMAVLGAAQRAAAPLLAASHACQCSLRPRLQQVSRSSVARISKSRPTAPLTARLQRTHERLQSLRVAASASGSLTAAPSEPPFKWGADMKNLGISVAAAVLVWLQMRVIV